MAETQTNLSPKEANALRRLADKYNRLTNEADEVRTQLDGLVFAARDSGGTFREIAALATRSVAWVQGSLERTEKRRRK